MFLVLSAKTKILSDELIFCKSFAKVSWKWFLVSRNLMFSKSFKMSSRKVLIPKWWEVFPYFHNKTR